MAGKSMALSDELYEYVLAHGTPRDAALVQVEEKTAALGDIAVMQTSPDESAFLELLVRLVQPQLALEVGTFTGYGAIRIARGLPDGGRLICCELSQDWADTARANIDSAGVGDRVEIRVGPALGTLQALPTEPSVGFAYIDADKGGYPEYYEEVVTRLLPGGIVVLDNVLLGGRVLDPQDDSARAVAGLNDRIPSDDRVEAVMLAIADGVTIARRK
jgi:caffeoyl-CoA O-methyltransferase